MWSDFSAQINSGWPDDSRFHSEVVDVPPGVIVITSYRSRETYSFFAIPENDGMSKQTHLWQTNGLDRGRYRSPFGSMSVSAVPLSRGPTGKARFLAGSFGAGCAGSISVAYSAYEWDPQGVGSLEEIIKLEGAGSQYERVDEHVPPDKIAVDSFPPIGEMQTEGVRVKLPYCWFSTIDTWDDPSLCAVNTYDLSGDRVRFVGSVVNRPDLLSVAKAIEYAQAHDYPAVRAWCGSDEVAQELIRVIPPFVFADELRVERINDSRESVEFGFETIYTFEVEKNRDRWVVISFRME